jgi:apolipoprotein N-acyltransferase
VGTPAEPRTIDGEAAPLVSRRTAYLLALAAGTLYFLGFAASGRGMAAILGELGVAVGELTLWPIALVALVPLVVAFEGQSARRTLEIGAIAGFTMNMMGFYWLYGMLQTFSGFPGPFCFVIMAALCAYQGGRIALFGWLYGRARARGYARAWVFSLAFAVSELVYPLLFPWYFAASVHDVPALTQLAEWGGPYIVGLVLLAPSLAVGELVVARLRRRPVTARALVAGGLAVPIVAAAIGYLRLRAVDQTALASAPVHVGLVQGNMPLMHADHRESLARHTRLTETLRQKGADFAVWSEAAVMSSIPEEDHDAQLQRLFTRRLRIPAIFGALLVGHQGERARYYNVALATDVQGHVVGRYDKHYLLAFGEYLPFGEAFPVLYDWSPNSGHLTPGTSSEPLTVAGHSVATLVCYEDILPAFVNAAMSHGHPEMIVNVTNDAWFGDTTEPWIHLALAQLRAVEHRRYLLRSTNTGVSAVIDPVGRVIAHGGTFRQETVDAIAHWMTGARTGYEVWGDAPWWVAAAAVLVMAFVPRRRLVELVRRPS